ncbi:hypothetical protein GQ457_18G005620 [Hibiscus cannabinus]
MYYGNEQVEDQQDQNAAGNVGVVVRPMAICDHLTPILDDLNPGIMAPEIQETHFELKPVMQADDESMYEYWEKYKELLCKCTNHGFQD